MNRKICSACPRFSTSSSDDGRWLCAGKISYVKSFQIPNHKFLKRSEFVHVSESRTTPPSWCGFIVEQSVAESNEDINVRPFPEYQLIPDSSIEDGF